MIKKYLFPLLMGLVILFGLILSITPYIADAIYPASEEEVRQAKSRDVAQALKAIFQSPDADIEESRAIHKKTATKKTAWFSFRTTRKPMQHFIHARQLQQKELSPQILAHKFYLNKPPVPWWKPDLGTETYFEGKDGENSVYLIYNSRIKRGVLVISTVLVNNTRTQ
jgi:hypothetical protein